MKNIFGEHQSFRERQKKKKIGKETERVKREKGKKNSLVMNSRGSKKGAHSFVKLYCVFCHLSYALSYK